jgi:hypothetical protein
VAQAVVDVLEAIEVEKQHREIEVLAPLSQFQHMAQAIEKQSAIRQFG